MSLRAWHLLLAAIFLSAIPAWGQFSQSRTATSGQGIEVTADKLTSSDGGSKIEASGNVEIKRQESTLKADEVQFDRQTQDMEAKGNVSLDAAEWKVKSADSMQFNMEKETGELQNGDVFIEQGQLSMTGRRLQKFAGQTYHVDDGFFTTCLCETGAPPWKFSAEQMDLTLQGLGVIRHGYLYILDVPVFYLPYGFFPLGSDRQSGFLVPKVGHSSTEGFRFQQPFFWAISKSTDATAAFDVETSARLGILGEFRTKFNAYSDLQLDSSYFNELWRKNAQQSVVDPTLADPTIPKNRWSIIGTHRYPTASDWLTFSDLAGYSDNLFTRELVERFDFSGTKENDLRASRFGVSRFGVFRGWNDTFFKSEWNFYQDFIQLASMTLQKTPQLAFWGQRLLSNFPLEFRWQAEGVNYIRRKTGDGFRLDLRPEVVLPFKVAPYLFGNLSVAPRETVYHLYTPVEPGDRNISRELVEIRYNIGTSLNRVFTVNSFGLNAVKHIIEPEINYLFVPPVNQSAIPIMDNIDRIPRRNVFTFALTNRIWGRAVNPLALASDKDIEVINPTNFGIQDIGSVRLALSYDVGKVSGNKRLSDLDMNMRLNPTNFLSLRFDGGVSTGPWQVTQARATLELRDPTPFARRTLDPDFTRADNFSLSYQFLRNGPNGYLSQDANINIDEPANCVQNPLDPRCPGTGFKQNILGSISTNTFYKVTDHILLTFNSNFDLINKTSIGLNGSTKYLSMCECWTASLNVSQTVNPAKTGFSFNFSVLGLGSQPVSAR